LFLTSFSNIKTEYTDFEVLFTGKADDYRNPDYISEIHSVIEKDKLSPYIKMMGLIPREDQLGLMKNALAVIQPSKFEGWSTVVEDAKSLQQQIILSDLAVHIEQMEGLAHFFEQDNTQQLKDIMKGMLMETNPNKPVLNNYEERVRQYAKEFLSIFGW
jgi:glycosyltransferase involved in cell wall biosynthesis